MPADVPADMPADVPADVPANGASGTTAVVIVSARPMFRRVFGKLVAALRDDLSLETREALPAAGELPAGAMIVFDAAGLAPEALAAAVAAARERSPRVVAVLDESDDAACDAAMEAGAAGVMIKAAPPGVIAEWLDALLAGERVRPAPSVALDTETLTPALRARLSARRQKLLRLQLGGSSVSETARQLGMTTDKVVTEMRVVMDIVRGRDGGD